MTDADFLQEILAHPDDDAPRLIYADWLEERGNPRGEFIRVQCELACVRRHCSRYRNLRRRELALLSQHYKQWLGEVAGWVRKWEFRRGFVEYIEISTRDFLKRAADIFTTVPVQRAFLRAGPRRMPALADCPQLARIRQLEFHHTLMGDAGIDVLIRSPYLRDLQHLKIYYAGIGPAGVAALASAATLDRLTCLNLGSNGIGRGLHSLAQSSLIGQLSELSLCYGEILEHDVAPLRHAPYSRRLQCLDLSSNPIRAGGAQALSSSPLLAGLIKLRLGSCAIADDGVEALAGSPYLTCLAELDLHSCGVGDAGVMALARSTSLGRLTALDLAWNAIGDQGVLALAASPLLARLTRLRLCQNRITLEGVRALTSSQYWTGKVQLDLRQNQLSPKVITSLQDRFGKSFGNFHRPPHIWGS